MGFGGEILKYTFGIATETDIEGQRGRIEYLEDIY